MKPGICATIRAMGVSFLLIMCAALAGCGQRPESVLRLGAIPWPGYEGFFLARSLGFLSHTPWQLVEYPAAPEVIRSFQNGAIEAAALTGDEFLRLAEQNDEARAILLLDFSNGADALLAGPDIARLADLQGRRVGVEPNSVGAFLLHRALSSASLELAGVRIIPLGNEEHLAAFEAGAVDAVVTFEPHRSRLLAAGARVLFDTRQIPGDIMDVLVVRASLIKERPKALQELVNSWFAAQKRFQADPLTSARLVAPREGLSPEAFIKSLEGVAIPSLEENRSQLSGPEPALGARLRRLRDLMIESKLLRSAPDPAMLVDGRFVEAAKE